MGDIPTTDMMNNKERGRDVRKEERKERERSKVGMSSFLGCK